MRLGIEAAGGNWPSGSHPVTLYLLRRIDLAISLDQRARYAGRRKIS